MPFIAERTAKINVVGQFESGSTIHRTNTYVIIRASVLLYAAFATITFSENTGE